MHVTVFCDVKFIKSRTAYNHTNKSGLVDLVSSSQNEIFPGKMSNLTGHVVTSLRMETKEKNLRHSLDRVVI